MNSKNQMRDIGARQSETEKKLQERAESLATWNTRLSHWEKDFGQLKKAKERTCKEIKKKYREAEEMPLCRLEAARKQKSKKEKILWMQLEEEIWHKIMHKKIEKCARESEGSRKLIVLEGMC